MQNSYSCQSPIHVMQIKKDDTGSDSTGEYSIFQTKCDMLLDEPEVRFAGIINHLGSLVTGGFKKNVTPLETNEQMKKIYMELALRVSMRKDFDDSLGPVQFSLSRRKKAVMYSFPIDNKILLVATIPQVSIEKFASKVMKMLGILY